ncbi:transcriptional regulator [Actinomadura gamaensis]|uniref:Transcriptional regulator n=1 Tax=Actinomadura gamaensis TaxID=1763541 RepID=A0ABV9U564_9ACTN
MNAAAVVFACVFIALYAAHELGDYWLQTHGQACGKGAAGRAGRLACARHVATLTAAKAVFVTVTGLALHLPLSLGWTAGALAADAVSHYWADRRTTLAWLAALLGRTLVPGKGEFVTLGAPRPGHDDNPTLGTGAAALDQSFHKVALFAAALLAALGVA